MSQQYDPQYYYIHPQPLRLWAQVSKKIKFNMEKCGFQLISTQSTYPQNLYSFAFVPMYEEVNHLPQPYQLYCRFSTIIYLQFDQLFQTIQYQIYIYNLTSYGNLIIFNQYTDMLQRLQSYLQHLKSNRTKFNTKQNKIELYFYPIQMNYFLDHQNYIKSIYFQIKTKIITLFFINKQHYDQLTTQQKLKFYVEHFVHQKDMHYNESRRLNKKQDTSKISKATNTFQQNIENSGILQLLTGKQYKKLNNSTINQLLREFSFKIEEIKRLMQQRQRDKQYMQNQLNISIYQYTLLQKLSSINLDDFKTYYNRNSKLLEQKNRQMSICQGITILHMEKQINKQNQIYTMATHLSTVSFIQCYARYHFSIHSSTNQQHDNQYKMTLQSIKMLESIPQKYRKQELKKDKSVKYKKLAKKQCSQLGKNQFINQHNFIKYMRYKAFLYISKYYLQEITSTTQDNNSTATRNNNNKQQIQQITKKPIYMQQYPIHLQQFLNSNKVDYLSNLKDHRVIHVLFQLVATLRYLSYFDILHRDIKTNNIMMEKNYTIGGYNVKLIDWGNSIRDQSKSKTINQSTKKNNTNKSNKNNNPPTKHKPKRKISYYSQSSQIKNTYKLLISQRILIKIFYKHNSTIVHINSKLTLSLISTAMGTFLVSSFKDQKPNTIQNIGLFKNFNINKINVQMPTLTIDQALSNSWFISIISSICSQPKNNLSSIYTEINKMSLNLYNQLILLIQQLITDEIFFEVDNDLIGLTKHYQRKHFSYHI